MKNLVEIPLFNGLTEAELTDVLEKIFFQRKSFPKDSLIASQGDVCNRLIILLNGNVKGEMTDPTGKNLKIEDIQAPSALASAFLFGKKSFFPVNIISTSEVEIIQIQRPELMKLFQLDERILTNYLGMISSRAQFLSEKLRFHSFKSLKAKLAFFLLKESKQQSAFKLKHSQNELAELFGVARPSVGRAFLQLQEEAFIDVRYREIKILNQNGLSSLFDD